LIIRLMQIPARLAASRHMPKRRPARVMAAAGSGQLLASRTVRDLVVGSDIAMDDLGTRSLKGVDGAWQLFAARP
jgi:class 3 adenylate cyclase